MKGIEIVAIGNEVLSGLTANTNAMWLSKKLSELGYQVSRHTTFPDDEQILIEGLKEVHDRADFVICTGGLGPTIDDITGPIAEKLFGNPEKFPNKVGSAEGLVFEKMIFLPGVPAEMKSIFEESVTPFLVKNYPVTSHRSQKKLNLCLLPERTVDPLLRQLKEKFPHIDFGIYPQPGVLNITLTTTENPILLEVPYALLKKAFFEHAFEAEDGKIDTAVHNLLISKKKSLSLAESVTGGSVAARITSHPGCSAYFKGGLVSYSNEAKINLLGVDPSVIESDGAVSEKVARQMAEEALKAFNSDYALSVTGVAGPDGGSEQKPIGTAWCGLAIKGADTHTWKIQGKVTSRVLVIEYLLLNLLSTLYLKLK